MQRLLFGNTFGKIHKELIQLFFREQLEPGGVGRKDRSDCSTFLYLLFFFLFCLCLIQLVQGFQPPTQYLLTLFSSKVLLFFETKDLGRIEGDLLERLVYCQTNAGFFFIQGFPVPYRDIFDIARPPVQNTLVALVTLAIGSNNILFFVFLAKRTQKYFDTVFQNFSRKMGVFEDFLWQRTTGHDREKKTFCFRNDDFNLTIKQLRRSILEGGQCHDTCSLRLQVR